MSYILGPELSAYGNGRRIQINTEKSISQGDSCNSTAISLPIHFGTHIDFPFHFGDKGQKSDDYCADDFVSSKVGYLPVEIKSDIIHPSELELESISSDINFLFINTGFWQKRDQDIYWNGNPSLHPDCADMLKKRFPQITLIGIDSISINPWKNKELGRITHKKLLLENNILIVEDVSYASLPTNPVFIQVIVSPLRVEGSDGALATILARIESDD